MGDTAVLVIDMMNAYRHADGDALANNAAKIIEPLTTLIADVRAGEDVDLIYVNDNYGDFTATRDAIVGQALDGAHPELVRPIVPDDDCAFLEKVRHSAFYASPLAYLLNQRDITRVILTGQVTEQCILYSALDAYVRHFEVVVPVDAVAQIDDELGDAALRMMQRNMRAALVPAVACLDPVPRGQS